MREKYESLALADLKAIAKARGIKGTSVMKKAEVVEAMLSLDMQEQEQKTKAQSSMPIRKAEQETMAESCIKRAVYSEAVEKAEPRMERAVRSEAVEKAEPRMERTVRSEVVEKTEPHIERTARSEGAEKPEVRTERPARAERTENERTLAELDSGEMANGILEVMPDGYGFIRCENYLPGENDVYVAPSQIRRFGLKTGDIIEGNTRVKTQAEKFSALLFVKKINGYPPEVAHRRRNFEDMTPIFPNERLRMETAGASVAMRIMDLMSPVGKGQRGMIVSPPKAGKTTLLKEVAKSIKRNNPEMHLIILLIDERPEEVTDIREAIEGPNVEVIYSTSGGAAKRQDTFWWS